MIIPSVFAEEKVPDWVKNNAGWWASHFISDNEFVNAIEFLIKEGIIYVDAVTGEKSDNIPDWVRNTAGWWATDQISETEFLNAIQFLIGAGVINISNYNCDQNEDQNRNGVPDVIEEIPVISGMSVSDALEINRVFENKNWSNCYFPKDLSFYKFKNVDLSYSDFSDSKLFNAMFVESTLLGADFSNTDLRGAIFFLSDLSYTNFENVDFSTDNWEEPFLIFTYTVQPYPYGQWETVQTPDGNKIKRITQTTFSCYYNPCIYYKFPTDVELSDLYTKTFGENQFPLNIRLVDVISDKSDQRSIWRHSAAFINSEIIETIFIKSDLAYAHFRQLDISNANFTDADLSNVYFLYVNFNDVKPADNLLSGTIGSEGLDYSPNTELSATDQDASNKKFTTLHDLGSDDFNIVFDHTLDYPPINWSMGMTIYDEKLYVADTDNHRIIVYDLENNEKLLTFTSPLQEYCETIEVCAVENRNLPTSIKIIDEKIFVAYGFQDEIQVFDLGGNYLWKFGSFGTQAGQFNAPHRIATLNNELFVADSENHRIQVFDNNGNFLRQFGTNGDSIGQLSEPIDLYAYNGQIFVADSIRATILVFDLNGKFMKEFVTNQNVSDISEPRGVFVYDDLIFVSDVGDFSVKVFDLDGNLVKQFGQHGDRYGEFKYPIYTITDGKKIFVSDAYNYRIQIFKIVGLY